MRTFLIRLLLATISLLCLDVYAQAQEVARPLHWPELRTLILTQHPLAIQAGLVASEAEAALLRAKGGFDPKLYADVSEKSFSGSQYFRYAESGISWPGFAGMSVKGAYNRATGAYLNPEGNLPLDGQASLGLHWTLGSGLLMDQRRANLRIARAGVEQGDARRAGALNDLLLGGANLYWDWVLANDVLSVYREALQQADVRLDAVILSHQQGDLPAIDTLETLIQQQNRVLDLNDAIVNAQNAGIALSNFLWDASGLPLADQQLPTAPALAAAQGPAVPEPESLRRDLERHPMLRQYRARLDQLETARKLRAEDLKPDLNLSYYLLGNGWQMFPSTGTEGLSVLTNDVKWGLQFAYPIPNRTARGGLQMATIQKSQLDYEWRQRRIELENALQQVQNELVNLEQQLELYQSITDNYRTLLDGELQKFQFGESSVFLVNAREQRWLDARISLLRMQASFRKKQAALLWTAGRLQEF